MDAFLPLYFGIIDDPRQLEGQLRYVITHEDEHIPEERSYIPEILWRYGADEEALQTWLTMTAPDYDRREYPEVSFAALGAIACGYLGIRPDAARRSLETRSAVLGNGYAEINYLPLWGGHIHLLHEGRDASTLENLTGSALTWNCRFDGAPTQTAQVPAGGTMRLRRGNA